jgi:hypothetical protein
MRHRRPLAFLALILACLAVPLVKGCGYHEHQQITATAEAKQWAAEMGYEPLGVVCADRDSDGDGYVSCALRVAGAEQPVQIECAGALNFASGCRIPKIKSLGR